MEDLKFLRANTSRTIKITVPGPFIMAQQAQDDYYGSTESLALGYAEAVGEEVQDLFAAGMPVPMSRNCRIPASAARNRTTRARNARLARTEATMPG